LNEPAAPPRWLLIVRAVLGSVAFVLLGFAFTQALALLFYGAAEASGGGIATWAKDVDTGQAFLFSAAAAIAFAAATWLVGMVAFRLSLSDLRWRDTGGVGRGVAVFFVTGAVLAGLVLLLAAAIGGARWSPDAGDPRLYLERIGVALLLLAPAALAEEIVFRGVPLILLDRTAGRGLAIGVTALLFALAHSYNPDITTLSIGNICVAGLFLGIALFARGGLWAALGFHLGWNWAIVALDAPVSGIDFRIPFINYNPGGPAWLTGGKFGPEGGVIATLVLGLATIVASRMILHRRLSNTEHRTSAIGH
jgi:membrane protease YdiL (CAAX protease family)